MPPARAADDPASTPTDATDRPDGRADDHARRRVWRIDAAFLAMAAVALRLPALLAPRHLTFDDGQYGVVVLGLRAGDLPFRDLFSSQGPLYYPLLAVADVVGLRTLDGPRLLPVAAGMVATVATYAIARHLGTRSAAILAAVLVATSGSLLYVTGPLSGDGPALALALVAIVLALRHRARPSSARAVAVGLAMGAAICVKLIVVPAAIPIGILMTGIGPSGNGLTGTGSSRWVPTRAGLRALGTSVAAAVAVLVAAVLPWGPERVWDQSVAYHQDSERLRGFGGNFTTLVQTLAERDPFLVLALLAGLGAIVWRAIRGGPSTIVVATPSSPEAGEVPRALARWIVLPWLALQVVFLVIEPTMWRPHIAQVVAPLALATVLLGVPAWRLVVAVCVVLTPWWFHNTSDIVWPDAYPAAEAAIVERLRALPAGAMVISDDPGFAWRAERRVPPNFVDVSMKRFQQGQLTAAVVGRAAADAEVCAVLVLSPARLGSLPDLHRRLRAAGYEVASRSAGTSERVLYERTECDPPRS
ncbi:MAG TPA: glycosyltransferase family 39 protein [Acidimicrobiia bacterium]|nr:glycosyltransferase family 39 protein [Acidimicrobiia bacterium]